MTLTDPPDDDRTVVRPTFAPGHGTSPAEATTFQATERHVPPTQPGAVPPPAAPAPRSPGAGENMGYGLPVGTRLGQFEITALVGVGGFGIVYQAIDHSLGRKVALKEYMPTALAARTGGSQIQAKSERYRETFDAGLKSFVNEGRLLASFDHLALVKVYLSWKANGTAYMVMPFLQGKTLRDLLREHRAAGLPAPDEAWLRSVLGPLTEALMVIHAKPCYHRDIAPDNVMQLPNGRKRPGMVGVGIGALVLAALGLGAVMLMIVSERPRDFGALGLQAADPIPLFPAPAELAPLAAAHAGGAPLLAGRPRCPDAAACSEAYGAALLRFDTVR